MSDEPISKEQLALQRAVGERICPSRVRDLGMAIVQALPREEMDMWHLAAALGFAEQFFHLGQVAHQHLIETQDWDRTVSLSEQLDVAIQIGRRFGSSLAMMAAKPEGTS
jgi:hypothetical protein